MKKAFDKKELVNILFGVVIFILAANLVVGKLSKNGSQTKREENSNVIESQFKDGLFNLGIKEDWITRQKGNDEPIKFSVKVPKDLPIVLILQEINNVFNAGNVEIKSLENKVGGKTSLDISSGEDIKLESVFNYDGSIARKSVRVGFLVNRFKEDAETDSLLLDFTENFAVVLTPSKSSTEFVKKIIQDRKEYVIYLSDNIGELEYKLKSNYRASRLKNAVRSIVGAFPQSVFFLIDDKSDLYNSPAYFLIKKEMGKRKIRLMNRSNFSELVKTSRKDVNNLFDSSLDKLQGGEDKIFIVSEENFLSLKPEIIKYRKLGYRFSNPSALLH